MKALDRTILIDRYLSGEASPEEKLQVERLLSDPELSLDDKEAFRQDMELQEDIIIAIQERGLRKMLQREEERLRAESNDDQPPIHIAVSVPEAAKPAAAASRGPLWLIRSAATIAIAACMAGPIVIAPQVSRMVAISNNSEFYSAATIEMTEAYSQLKGCDEPSDAIIEATALMQSGDYRQADALLADALQSLPKVTKADGQAWSEKEDLLYLRALCAIKQHKLYRSRRLLNEVVRMDGLHRDQAAELLHTIKHGR